MTEIVLGPDVRWPLDDRHRRAVFIGAVGWGCMVLAFATFPVGQADPIGGLIGASAAILGSIARQLGADRVAHYPHRRKRAAARLAFWVVVFGAWVALGVLLNRALGRADATLAALLFSLGLGLWVVASALWEGITRERAMVWAAWGGLALMGAGAIAAAIGVPALAGIWFATGVALVAWQLLQQRRPRSA